MSILSTPPRNGRSMPLSRHWFFGYGFRETREGWPLLIVEIEVNEDSQSTKDRDTSLVGSLGLWHRYRRFLFSLGCPAVQNICEVVKTFSMKETISAITNSNYLNI
jgi:hypothetical protein